MREEGAEEGSPPRPGTSRASERMPTFSFPGSLPQSLFQPNHRSRHQRRRRRSCACLPTAAATSATPRFMEPWARAGERRRGGPSGAGQGRLRGGGDTAQRNRTRNLGLAAGYTHTAEARQQSPGPPLSQRPLLRV